MAKQRIQIELTDDDGAQRRFLDWLNKYAVTTLRPGVYHFSFGTAIVEQINEEEK